MVRNPLFAIDFYKADHRRQYPEGTTEIYSNLTARSVYPSANNLPGFDNHVVMFGLQHFIQSHLIRDWNDNFFSQDIEKMALEYEQMMVSALGVEIFDTSHIVALHKLGYLPIRIKAIEEGIRVPIGIPLLTIVNTHPDFYWLTNYLETMLSASLWKAITSATIAFEYKKILSDYAELTGVPENFVNYQAHDFSFRGMSGLEDAALSGAGHLTSFIGTDCVPAIELINQYYPTDNLNYLVGSSVPATEHSVMTCLGKDKEFETIKRLITEVYPDGIVSIVCDSYDLWQTLTVYLPSLYKEISAREGKVVIRPDSGDPVAIICGDPNAIEGSPASKGALQLLWEQFGGRVNSAGYKELNSKVGLIYGDAITLPRALQILDNLKNQGFASSNIVFGIGSYTYQYVTRDTFGFAVKATSAVINGERHAIYKDPITANGGKTSARGLLKVELEYEDGQIILEQDVSEDEEKAGILMTVFEDGELCNLMSLQDIRDNLQLELELCKMLTS